jgi:outer membrane protein insertion porin family
MNSKYSISGFPFLFIFSGFLTVCLAQPKIICVGNKYIDSVAIFSSIKNVSGPLSRKMMDTMSNRLKVLYQDNGYFTSRITSEMIFKGQKPDTVLQFTIQENEPALISRIAIDLSDSLPPASVFLVTKEMVGKSFSVAGIEERVQEFLKYFENNGYPFAAVRIGAVIYDPVTNSVAVSLRIILNGQFHIDRLSVSGKTDIKPEVVMRELKFKTGMLYNQEWVDRIPQRLNRMKLFDVVGNPAFIVSSSNEGILQVPLQDKNNNTFDGVIGYIPSNKAGEKGYISGFLDVAFRNIFGTARSATFLWKRLDNYSSELDFSYMEPWVLNYPFNVSIHFNQTKQDSTYVSWSFEPSLEYIAGEALTLSMDGGYGRVIPTLLDTPACSVYNATKLYGGLSIRYDTRDDPFVPRSGFLFLNSYTYTSKRINGPAEYITPDIKKVNKQQKELFDVNYYFEVIKLNILYFGLHGRMVEGDLVEIADLFKLGGANTLRGYRENQFSGQRIAWSNMEYRIILEKRTYAFAFFDMGFIDPGSVFSQTGSTSSTTKNGYGIGLNFQTGLGIMNVSFAIANGQSFSQGVIHFGLKNDF